MIPHLRYALYIHTRAAKLGETLFAGRACNEFLQDVPLIGHLPLFIARVFFWRTPAERAAKPREGTFSPMYRSNGQGSGWGWG